ncbi:FG-GAP repeat domain-containing protein [Leifsonia virtsii]|uniref:VCBS repeat-containing protein n=1 Tax=Leifsonia virtsii TaxID=3035915 RepID=A0ABT8IXP4_9MICO|nr:VCBS repeat-containing protein [Leifsonia virtsii]MDN4597181.1 VCBS repeat-containing protein [Leifsonia virtsii]
MTATRNVAPSRLRAGCAITLTLLLATAGLAGAVEPASAAAPRPTAAGAPAIQAEHLHGTLRVTRTEPVLKKGQSLSEGAPTTAYTVTTADGTRVPISGDIPAGAKTGAIFDGTVSVRSGRAAARFTSGASATPLAVSAATVTPGVATVAQSHVLDLVVINPVGVAPVDSSVYDQSALVELATRIGDFWHWQSVQDRTTDPAKVITFTTTPTVPVLSSDQPCSQSIDTLWDQAAVALGYASAQNYLDTPPPGGAHHLDVILPPGCADAWSGISTIGDGIGSSGLISETVGLSVDRMLLAQGIGVNFGIGSSDLAFCGRTTGGPNCTTYAYGDGYDVMGNIWEGYDSPDNLNSRTLAMLGWVPAAGAPRFALAQGEAVHTWKSQRLQWAADAQLPSMLQLTDPATQSTYYLEDRSGYGWTSPPAYVYDNVFAMDAAAEDLVEESRGVRLLTSTPDNGSVVITQPDTRNPYNDAAVINGWDGSGGLEFHNDTVTNESGSISVTVTASDAATATVDITLRAPRPRLHDYSGDAHPDVLARNTAGGLFSYHANGAGGWATPTTSQVGSGWNVMTAIVAPGDFNGDGHPDVLARDSSGVLWLYPGNGAGGWGARRAVGTGWNIMTKIVGVGDFTGDGTADIVATDTSGRLLLYPGNGTGGWLKATAIGSGWAGMVALAGVGDFNGDGQPDLLAEDAAGALWLYPHTLTRWLPRLQVGSGWRGMTQIVSVGDFDGDGTNDVVAADPRGALWLYRGTGESAFDTRTQIGSGWGLMTWLG